MYLQEEVSGDKNVAELVVSLLEYTVLGDLVRVTEIHYDPDIKNSVVQADREFVKEFYDFSDKTDEDLRRLSPWVLRVELDKALVYVKKIKMDEISTEIANEYGTDLHVEVSDDNADELIVRVRIVNDTPSTTMFGGGGGVDEDGNMIQDFDHVDNAEVGQDDDVFLKRLEKSMLSTLKLRGVGTFTNSNKNKHTLAKKQQHLIMRVLIFVCFVVKFLLLLGCCSV